MKQGHKVGIIAAVIIAAILLIVFVMQGIIGPETTAVTGQSVAKNVPTMVGGC